MCVIVRPGEQIPVDGEVVSGQATVDQAAITGEGMPVEAGPGSQVYAATFARLGHLRIRATHIGADTTFGKVIRLVEEAEAHRADVQRIADRFSAWFLPIVAGIAALTLIISRDPLATASVLVVACSCSIALATPIAMLASIGAGAQRGLLIKGGRYLELLGPGRCAADRQNRDGDAGEAAGDGHCRLRISDFGFNDCTGSIRNSQFAIRNLVSRRVRRALLGASAGRGGAGGGARSVGLRWPSRPISRRCRAWACAPPSTGCVWRSAIGG